MFYASVMRYHMFVLELRYNTNYSVRWVTQGQSQPGGLGTIAWGPFAFGKSLQAYNTKCLKSDPIAL